MADSLILRWRHPVPNPLLDAGYKLWRVEREDTPGNWTAVAPDSACPPIGKDTFDYVFRDTYEIGAIKPYRAYPYNPDAGLGGPVETVTAAPAGYCSVADIRAQGYTAALYPDDVVRAAIVQATQLIDRITRQWFEPRFRWMMLDGKSIDTLWPKVPIICVQLIEVDEQVLDVEELEIYNRHLTHGIVNPDDRADPRIAWGDARIPIDVQRLYGGGRFPKARKSIRVGGIFGYTDLSFDGHTGETVVGSQVPLDYGETPAAIKRACTKLAILKMVPFDEAAALVAGGKVTGEKTRDQSYTLASPSTADASYGLTGDIEVDKTLQMYAAPFDCKVV
jgi:hypothetical protein